jgi:hypothetical protein
MDLVDHNGAGNEGAERGRREGSAGGHHRSLHAAAYFYVQPKSVRLLDQENNSRSCCCCKSCNGYVDFFLAIPINSIKPETNSWAAVGTGRRIGGHQERNELRRIEPCLALPGNRLSITKETAARTIFRQACRPYNTCGTFRYRAFGIGSSHVGSYPARTHGVDFYIRVLEFIGENTSYRIQCCL